MDTSATVKWISIGLQLTSAHGNGMALDYPRSTRGVEQGGWEFAFRPEIMPEETMIVFVLAEMQSLVGMHNWISSRRANKCLLN
jgi:hypothetical protein